MTWGHVSTGINGSVTVLKVMGGQLYAGGSFTIAGGKTVNHIALWDGAEWHGMDTGLNGIPTDLTVLDGDLIVAGNFTQAGGSGQLASSPLEWRGVGAVRGRIDDSSPQ